MNVLVDSSLFLTGFRAKTGHGRIWANLLQRIPADIELFCNSRIRNLPAHLAKPLRGSPLPVIRPYRVGIRLSDWSSHLIAATHQIDLLVPSHLVPQTSTLQLARRIPMVTLLDDLTPELVPGTMPQWLVPKKTALKASTLIIAISESTKKLAMDYYGLPAERFRVAPLASDIVRPPPTVGKRVHERPYFLVVGNRQGYKNFATTVNAFASIKDRCPGVDLVLAGPPFADFEQRSFYEQRIERRVYHAGVVNDVLLARLYSESIALVYPSLSEGFGIPPLEAMICGTIPIVSNSSSMPEVVGDAGWLIDPHNAQSLAQAMETLFQNSRLRLNLVNKGKERAHLFSWDKTCDLIFSAWRSATKL